MKKIVYVGDLSAVIIGGVYNRKVKRNGKPVDLPDDLAEELLARKIKGRPQWKSAETKKGAASTSKKTRKGVD